MPKNTPSTNEEKNLLENNPFSLENIKKLAYRQSILDQLTKFMTGQINWQKLKSTQLLKEIDRITSILDFLHKRILSIYIIKIMQKRHKKQQPIKTLYPIIPNDLMELIRESITIHRVIYELENILISSYTQVIGKESDTIDNAFLYNLLVLAGGYANFRQKSEILIGLTREVILKNFQEPMATGVWRGFLLTLPYHPEEVRMEAALRIYDSNKEPIYHKKYKCHRKEINREIHHRANLSGKTPKELKQLSILGSIFNLPKATYKKERKEPWEAWKETVLEEVSLNELMARPEKLKSIMSRLTFRDYAPWESSQHENNVYLPYIEESLEKGERMGELELATQMNIVHDWNLKVEQEEKQAEREAKLDSLNLTPRERLIIEAQIKGMEPPGTPGSIKTAISKLRKKMRKK